jgi:hypothetical protein
MPPFSLALRAADLPPGPAVVKGPVLKARVAVHKVLFDREALGEVLLAYVVSS